MVYLGTRFGTSDATPLGTGGAGVSRYLYALTNFSAANYYATQAAGGEAGIHGSFGGFTVLRPTALSTGANRTIVQKRDVAAGWVHWISTANELVVTMRNAAPAWIDSPRATLTASDVGRVHVALFYSSGSQLRLWLDRVERPGAANLASYVAAATAQQISGYNGGEGLTGADIVETATFRGNPTDDQLRAAFDAIRAQGTIPTTGLAGLTITHKWPDRTLLKQLAAPASIPDVVTNAAADAMTKAGAPTVVAIDQTAPRTWGYETQPILYGTTGHTTGSRWQSQTPMPTIGNASGNVWFAILARLDSQSVASATRYLGGLRDIAGGGGLSLVAAGTNASVIPQFADGTANTVNAPAVVLTAADVGKLLLIIGQHDGAGKGHTYVRRAEQATGSAVNGYTPPTNAYAQLGGININGSQLGGDGWTMFGLSMGHGVLTLAEIQALYDACVVSEDLALIPNRAQYRWRLTSATRGTSGVRPALIVEDAGQGGPALALTGTAPVVSAAYSRAWGW